jgi:AraC-like DNA-binding protein
MKSVTEVVMLLGAVQGLVLALAVLGRKRARSLTANRVLALFLLLVSVRLVDVLLVVTGRVHFGHDWTLSLPFTYSPLLWVYVRALTEPGFRVTPRLGLHALPALAIQLIMALAPRWLATPAGLPDPIDVLWTVQAVTYVGAILARLRRHRRRVEELSSSDRMRLDWVRSLTVGYGAVLALMLVYLGSFAVGHPLPSESSRVLYAGVAVVVYAWGYLGLRHSEVLSVPPEVAVAPAPVSREQLDDAAATTLRGRLLRLMTDDKPYLDPDLTLRDLATRLEVPAHVLSQVINRGLGQNFFRFVNEYRVAEAKRLLAGPGAGKVLNVALDAGFSAKSSFNRVFRELAGVTPSEYRRAVVARGSSPGEEGSTS